MLGKISSTVKDNLNTLAEIATSENTIIEELNRRATIKSKMGRFDTMMEQANIRRAELHSRLLRAKSDEAAREEGIRQMEAAFQAVVDMLLNMRMEAKANKDWATSDKIRNELTALGFEIKDTKDGATWKLNK